MSQLKLPDNRPPKTKFSYSISGQYCLKNMQAETFLNHHYKLFVEWMRNGPQDRLPLPHRDDPSLISFVFQLLILSYGAYRIAYRLCMYYIPSRHYLGMFVANASKKSSNECMYIAEGQEGLQIF